MDSNSFYPFQARSWYDWALAQPLNPLDIISNAYINKSGIITAQFQNAADFLSSTWTSSPLSVTANPSCIALGTDNAQNVADAAQWNFNVLTGNLSATLAPPLQKVFFLRGGDQWEMDFPMTSGATTVTDILLTFLDNAGTRGDSQGTVPCLAWRGYSKSGTFTLGLTFRNNVSGPLKMGLWSKDSSGNIALLELDFIVEGPNASSNQLLDSQLSLGDFTVTSFPSGGGNPPVAGNPSGLYNKTCSITQCQGTCAGQHSPNGGWCAAPTMFSTCAKPGMACHTSPGSCAPTQPNCMYTQPPCAVGTLRSDCLSCV